MIVSELADILGAKLEGDPSLQVKRVNSLEDAKAGDVSFLSSASYFSKIEKCQATAVLVPKNFNGKTTCAILRVENPDRSFGEAALCFYKPPPLPMLGVHESAIVACDVKLGKDVSIGANSVIDRGALGNTKIGDGVKMDNHIHIAHNVSVGENTAMAGMVGIAGSVKIGKNCKFGGQVGTVDHIEIADNITVLAKTLVTKSLTEPGAYSGVMPIQKHKDSLKFAAKLKK